MGNEVTELQSFKNTLATPYWTKQFSDLLPREISPGKFVEVTAMAVGKNKDLLSVVRDTLFYEILECAKDGLVPDGKEAVILKFGNVAKYLPMIKGVNKKILGSGQVRDINQEIVYEKDHFQTYTKAGEKVIDHAPMQNESGHPAMVSQRGKPCFCFVVIRTINGGVFQEVMDEEEILKVKAKARSKNVWEEWPEEMWKKTVTKRLAKRCNFSATVQRVLDRDDDLYDLTPSKPPQPRENKLERLIDSQQGEKDG